VINSWIVFDFFCILLTSTCERAIYHPLICQQDGAWALFVTGVYSASAVAVSLLYCTKGLASGAGRRSVPRKQARTFPDTLNALNLTFWPLIQREYRGATTDNARESLTES
jgi:hypothetical protein